MATEPDEIKPDGKRKKDEDGDDREASAEDFAAFVGCAYPDENLVASASPS